ncbi:ABC-ATPase domain-containing protein [Staphylococcus sp. SQ8-PEA]|uniref:ABC-ATPase domain-containing protein n=1 Tax=Staphylococcus marylandisciuri TaxID=2981529 RepID=A0ABT2QQR6_9STAP|nr:ABC-ATPase domain-containing protein [Staphylococcus marylandisciuri]MCU5746323.1 ABC-ATPase domain-containing protein [Staphylococcus marylandisciuri]
MKSAKDLNQLLHSIDGGKYGAYKRLNGNHYQFSDFQFIVEHVQADPFAPPSKVRVLVDRQTAGIPSELLDTKDKVIAVTDFLTRAVGREIQLAQKHAKGSKGKMTIDRCGQEILERSAVQIDDDSIEVRFEIGLPAAGRKILGKAAANIMMSQMPRVIDRALKYHHLNQEALHEQVRLYVDQQHIRAVLDDKQLVAFVGNGAILPRKNGVSDLPLNDAIPFNSPSNYEIAIDLPSGTTVKGMGIPDGITLIVGGGFHGKSTLLEALEIGVYNHIAKDGREMVITRADGMKIRAEDGRSVEKVNITPFIDNLPGKKDTARFSTTNASGSTSQAANTMEALEAKSSLLLIDEDTTATNFMIRDDRMQKLIAPEKEPITPFASKVKPLYDDYNVSTILIVGGSGDYFDVADQVFMMDEYRLKDVTSEAKKIADSPEYHRDDISDREFGNIPARVLARSSFNHKGKASRLKAKGKHSIMYGKEPIDISGLEQLTDPSQTNCIALMLDYYQRKLADGQSTLYEIADAIYNKIEEQGFDAIAPNNRYPGNLALPRKQEFIAAVNRYRGLDIK